MTSSSTSTAKGWFILHFEEPETALAKDILYLNDPRQSIAAAASDLEHVIFERFGRLGDLHDLENGDGCRIQSLSVASPGADSTDLQITFSQLVTYIRDLPASPSATKPDLFGLGGNVLRVKFEYMEIYY